MLPTKWISCPICPTSPSLRVLPRVGSWIGEVVAIFFASVFPAADPIEIGDAGTVRCNARILAVSSVATPLALSVEFMKVLSCCKLFLKGLRQLHLTLQGISLRCQSGTVFRPSDGIFLFTASNSVFNVCNF